MIPGLQQNNRMISNDHTNHGNWYEYDLRSNQVGLFVLLICPWVCNPKGTLGYGIDPKVLSLT